MPLAGFSQIRLRVWQSIVTLSVNFYNFVCQCTRSENGFEVTVQTSGGEAEADRGASTTTTV